MACDPKEETKNKKRETLSVNYKEIKEKFPNVKFNSQYIYTNNTADSVKGMRVSVWAKNESEFKNIKTMLEKQNYVFKILESGPIHKINQNGERMPQEIYFLKFNLLSDAGERTHDKY